MEKGKIGNGLSLFAAVLRNSLCSVWRRRRGEEDRKNGITALIRRPRRKVTQKQGYVVKPTGVRGENFTGHFELHMGCNSAAATGSVVAGEQ